MIPPEVDPWDYIHHPWSKFRKRMGRRYEDFKFVAILEAHKDKKFPHIHGFTNVWMHQKDWSSLWSYSKGGEVVWIERVKEDGVSEYVSKSLEVAKYVGKENLLEGYRQKKKHRTLWRSKDTRAKYELTDHPEWDIIKDRVFTEEGEVTSFFAKKGVWANGQKECKRKDLAPTCRAVP